MNQLKTVFWLAVLTALLVVAGNLVGGRTGMIVAFVFALVGNGVAYFFSDSIILKSYGARLVGPAEAPRLHAIVDELALRAGIPKPRVAIMESPVPNAFATGRNPQHAVVAATTGLLEILDEDEIRGVLGHELGHVLNRDILLSSIAAVLGGAIAALAQMGWPPPWQSSSAAMRRCGPR